MFDNQQWDRVVNAKADSLPAYGIVRVTVCRFGAGALLLAAISRRAFGARQLFRERAPCRARGPMMARHAFCAAVAFVREGDGTPAFGEPGATARHVQNSKKKSPAGFLFFFD